MPIQLDKILANIVDERVLHPNYSNASKKDVDDAWARVGRKNKLSVHEARSIFKVLQKKYEQERVKDQSAWKLFGLMHGIHRKIEVKPEVKEEEELVESDLPMEEDEEYEMLEVQEEDEHNATYPSKTPSGFTSDNESVSKSIKSNGSSGSPEKDEKASLLKTVVSSAKQTRSTTPALQHQQQVEERKILNSLPPVANKLLTTSQTQAQSAAAALSLQKKGITMKKSSLNTTPGVTKLSPSVTIANTSQNALKPITVRPNNSLFEVGKTIQLPESIKRKLADERSTTQPAKRPVPTHIPLTDTAQHHQEMNNSYNSAALPTQIKQEKEDSCNQALAKPATAHGINVITIPANLSRDDLANGVTAVQQNISTVGNAAAAAAASASSASASASTNGFSPRIEDIDFRNGIIFDANAINNGQQSQQQPQQQQQQQLANRMQTAPEIINLGNFDNSLPPTFFKNLCNSSRHEALGLYVANLMNRLDGRSAAKLELGILRAIVDVQSDIYDRTADNGRTTD